MEFKTAAVYARYSSDNQREESIDAQLRAIDEYCSKENIRIIRRYIDEAQSAKSDDRVQFLALFSDILKGYISPNFVIVHKLDRFARNRYDSALYKKKLKDNGVKLLSVLERLDNSPESVILESVLEGMSEYYSLNLAREVMKGMKETALQCKHTGGTPPLGYKVNPDKTYSIDEQEAEAVRIIFEMCAEGRTYSEILDTLNSKGHKTKTGKQFGKNSIKDLIINEKYKGVFIFNKRISGKKHNRKYKDDSEIIRIPGGMPAIVPIDVWEDANKRVSSRAQGPRLKVNQYYLLTGKVVCGGCGSAYVGNSFGGRGNKKYYIYSCTSKIKGTGCKNKPVRKDKLEPYVIDTLKRLILNSDSIGKIASDLQKKFAEFDKGKDKEIKKLNKQKADLKTKVDKLLNMCLDGVINETVYKEKSYSVNLQYADICDRIDYLELKDYNSYDKSMIESMLYSYLEKLEDSNDKVKRKVIETFVDKVIIEPDRILLEFKFDPTNGSDRCGGGEPPLTLSEPISRKEFDALY